MKNIWKYLLLGCLTAVGGMFAAELAGDFFTGMDWGSAAVVGICMYLCVVVVTCTGVIICKLGDAKHPDETAKEDALGADFP